MSRKGKPAVERARAAARLACDGELRPLAELTAVSGASARGMLRWGTEGRAGVYLDVIKDPVRGWLSSPAAVRRFLKEWSEKTGRAPEKAG